MKKLFQILVIPMLFVFVLSCESKKVPGEVIIGTQVWSDKNLNVDKFRNGDSILAAKTWEEWKAASDAKTPAWCYFDNEKKNDLKYGKLYNWYAVNDPRGLAPVGWHVPSKAEWDLLLNDLGGKDVAGDKMKATAGWEFQGNGTNEIGFNGVPGGFRYENGEFANLNDLGNFWSSNEIEVLFGVALNLDSASEEAFFFEPNKGYGVSVRLVKN